MSTYDVGPYRLPSNASSGHVDAQGYLDFTPAARELAQTLRKRESKAQRILERLRQGPATSLELLEVGGIRYSARVLELRQEGHKILTENHLDYAVYSIEVD